MAIKGMAEGMNNWPGNSDLSYLFSVIWAALSVPANKAPYPSEEVTYTDGEKQAGSS